MHALYGFGVARGLAGAAIGALVIYTEPAVVLDFNSGNRARLYAIGNFVALFLINLVHGPLHFQLWTTKRKSDHQTSSLQVALSGNGDADHGLM